MTTCGLSLHHRNTESRKSLEQKCIFPLGTLSAYGINERSHFTSLLRNLCDHISTNGKAHLHSHINLQKNIVLQSISSNEGLTLETPAFYTFHGCNSAFIISFDKAKFSLPREISKDPPLLPYNMVCSLKDVLLNAKTWQ